MLDKPEYVILCDIGDETSFNIAGKNYVVDFNEIEKYLHRIYRIQFKRIPKTKQLEKVVELVKKKPTIDLRFYGDYPEESINWEILTDITNLQIDLWHIKTLNQISSLTKLKKLSINKMVSSKVSLSIIEPLQNMEILYTSVSKGIETVGLIKNLRFLSLREIKHNDLDFLKGNQQLKELWMSFGSFNNFKGISYLQELEKLNLHQVRGLDNSTAKDIINDENKIWALKLEDLKHLTNLDFIAKMKKLIYLYIHGLKKIESYDAIAEIKSLETFNGNKPLDGSLSGLKNLKHITIGGTYPKEEIDNLLNQNNIETLWYKGKFLKGKQSNLKSPFYK